MAGEKMEKMDKGKMEDMEKGMCGGTCMGKLCGSITGLLVLVSGVVFLLFGLGKLDGMTAHIVGGAALTLTGLGVIVHALHMCPMCK